MSQGEGDVEGAWNSGESGPVVSVRDGAAAVDGGDGTASVKVAAKDQKILEQLAIRTMSDPSGDPVTGAELNPGPGAGSISVIHEDDEDEA